MSAPGSGLAVDDVVNAYRWVLGREPESFEAIANHLRAADRASLRRRLLLSPEFRKKFSDIAAQHPVPLAVESLDCDIDRIVFLHIPKTGGTTLHALLAAAVGEERVSAERHNGLWHRTGAELAGARLFSGHYDRRCLSVVPGRRVRVVTLLREPGARLLSLYKFLRAHGPQLVASDNMALAAAARELGYGDFLNAALQINPAAVDNTYLRAYGARLPLARWEQRAEAGAQERLAGLDPSIDRLFDRAREFLDRMAAVGILEDFDLSLKAIFTALGLDLPDTYQIHQRLSDIIAGNEHFEPVAEFEVDKAAQRLMTSLTRYDALLYRHGQGLLAKAVGAAAKPKTRRTRRRQDRGQAETPLALSASPRSG